jgi:hypothetical protein
VSEHQTTTHRLADAWVLGFEAALQSAFQVQNASLVAGRSLLEQWETAVEQGQQAVLDAVRHRLRPPTTRSPETAQ